MQLYILFAVPVVFMTLWFYTATIAQLRFPTLREKAILLLIAHPDDEAMFFAPTLLALTRPELGNHVKILCLSSGNADGIGRVRKREILTSAALLGLRAEDDVLVHEDPAFPDSMQQSWPAERIAEVLSSLFAQRMARKAPRLVAAAEAEAGAPDPPLVSIDAVITFDAAGVSGHPNHTSLYRGVRAWLRGLMRGREGWECPVALYALTSTNVVRKYAALLDVPLTLLLCVRGSMRVGGKTGEEGMSQRLMFLSDALQWRRAQKAMTSAHKSQMRWFRWGWIVLSRYMVVNDLKWVKI